LTSGRQPKPSDASGQGAKGFIHFLQILRIAYRRDDDFDLGEFFQLLRVEFLCLVELFPKLFMAYGRGEFDGAGGWPTSAADVCSPFLANQVKCRCPGSRDVRDPGEEGPFSLGEPSDPEA